MSLWEHVKIREDLLDKSLDAKMAPSLNEVVLGTGHRIYVDSTEFIKRTYITTPLRDLIKHVVERLARSEGGTMLIPSAFGGGKTHAMILMYHLFKKPSLLKDVGIASGLADLGEPFKDVLLVVVDGTYKELAPSPLDPLIVGDQVIRTLWGYIAYKLGKYEAARSYDEKLIAPDVYGISQIIGDSKVLMLFDELAYYYRRLSRAPRPEEEKLLKNYAEQVIMFLRALSEYAERSKVVLIISIPAKHTDKGLEPEPGYEDFVNKVVKEVYRTAIRVGELVATAEDFAMILKTRIFSEIKKEGADIAYERYLYLHRDYRDEIADIAGKIADMYPFHPHFIEALRDVVEINKDLQKTRDALRIARMVVRKLLESKREVLLITPADIDLRDSEIRSSILTESYRDFDNVIDKIIRTTKSIPTPNSVEPNVYRELALRLVLYVFLKTYVYKPKLEPESAFPAKREIVTAVYDPLVYERYGLSPKVAAELLTQLASGEVEYRVPHLYTKEGRYWVTTLLDLNELIKNEADKVEEYEALGVIKRDIENLYARPFDFSKSYELKISVLGKTPYVISRPEPLELDEKVYTLVTVIEPVTDVAEGYVRGGGIYDLVFYKVSGGSRAIRRYSNTVVVLLSNSLAQWEKIKEQARRLIACRKLKAMIDKQIADKITAKFLKEQLTELEKEIERRLLTLIFNYFNYVAFPDYERGKVVKVVRLNATSKTFLEAVEITLKNNNKVVLEDEEFDVLPYILKGSGEWSEELSIDDIEKIFFEDPAKPMIPQGFVMKLVKVGIENLKIGVLRRSKNMERVFFKKAEGVESLEELLANDIVIPWARAAEIQLSRMEKVYEILRDECVERKYYVAAYEGKEYPLYELRELRPKDYLYVFKNSKLTLVTEKVCDTFEIEHEEKLSIPAESEARDYIDINVLVKKVGKFNKKVVLKVSDGLIEPSEGIPDFRAVWRIPMPKGVGSYVYSIEGSSEGMTPKKSTLQLTVFERYQCSERVPATGTLCSKFELLSPASTEELHNILTSTQKAVRGVKVVERCFISVTLPSRAGAEISIEASKVDIDDVLTLIKSLQRAFGLKVNIEGKSLVISLESGEIISPDELEKIKLKINFCCR